MLLLLFDNERGCLELLHGLAQDGAGHGDVEAHEAAAALVEHRPVVEAQARLVDKQVNE